MSDWGPGNFDNDAARDHLFELMQCLAEEIDGALDCVTEFSLSPTGDDEADAVIAKLLSIVVPNIEVICLLHESLGGGFLPEPSVVEDWRGRYGSLAAGDASDERRAVIAETFARLLKMAEQCWEE